MREGSAPRLFDAGALPVGLVAGLIEYLSMVRGPTGSPRRPAMQRAWTIPVEHYLRVLRDIRPRALLAEKLGDLRALRRVDAPGKTPARFFTEKLNGN